MKIALEGKETKKQIAALLAALAFTILAVLAIPYMGEFAKYGYLGAFLVSLISSATVILPVPGFAIVFALAGVLDPLTLGIVAGLGAGLGEITGYLAGFSGSGMVEKSKFYKGHKKEIEKGGPLLIFFLALIPNPAFDVAGIAAGSIRMPAWQFLFATCAGKIIRFVIIAETGAYLSMAF
jgi:membrane protein YqaA with SNARE-associated domain